MARSEQRGLRYMQMGAKFTAPNVGSTVIPRGSRLVQRAMDVERIGAGPGQAPVGFVGGTTSLSEWYIYWALFKLLGPEGDQWAYQESFLGGRHLPGGAVVDFVIYQADLEIGVRIQTFYFHMAAGSWKQASDIEQRIALGKLYDMQIVDVYEQDYINDESGQAALKVMREVLAGIEHFNPLATGLVTGSW